MDTNELYKRNMELLKSLGIEYKECKHEPVLDYETAGKVKKRFNLTGIESKNLFLKTKDGRYCMRS
jgi:Ala-tRNA(Pro) deacylase